MPSRRLPRYRVIALVLTTLFTQVQALAQGADPDSESDESVLDRLEHTGLIIRKGLTGVKEEKKPANASYASSDLFGSFYQVDVAMRWEKLEFQAGESTLLLMPSVEWHKSTQENSEKDKGSLGVTAEWLLPPLPRFRSENSPILVTSLSHEEDFAKNSSSISSSLLGTVMSTSALGPGGPIRIRDSGWQLRYYPYIGAEYYDRLPLKQGDVFLEDSINATLGLARLYVEYHPFHLDDAAPGGRLQIVGSYTIRRKLSGSDELSETIILGEISIVYYFDRERRVGFGIDYESGESPLNNFAHDQRTTIGLLFKL